MATHGKVPFAQEKPLLLDPTPLAAELSCYFSGARTRGKARETISVKNSM